MLRKVGSEVVVADMKFGIRAGLLFALPFFALFAAAPVATVAAPPQISAIYSTYFHGASGVRNGYFGAASSVAYDRHGNIYIAGSTTPTFPGAVAPQNTAFAGYIAKFNPNGSGNGSLSYLTYIAAPGENSDDKASETAITSIKVDDNGSVYFGGLTNADGLPTTANAPVRNCQYCDLRMGLGGFAGKLNPDGTIAFLTYTASASQVSIGPAGDPRDDFRQPSLVVNNQGVYIDTDSSGRLYVTHQVSHNDAPVTPNGYLTACSQFMDNCNLSTLLVFAPSAPTPSESLVYGTYIGDQRGPASTTAIAVDGAGVVYLAGTAQNRFFPVTQNTIQPVDVCATVGCSFIVKLDPSLPGAAALQYSSIVSGPAAGGGFDLGLSIRGISAKDGKIIFGAAADKGMTVTQGGIPSSSCWTNPDIAFVPMIPYVARINPDVAGPGAIEFATYVCGSAGDYLLGFTLAPNGHVLIAGQSKSDDLPNMVKFSGSQGCKAERNPNGIGVRSQLAAAFVSEIDPSASNPVLFTTCLSGTFNPTPNNDSQNYSSADAVAADGNGRIYVAGGTEDARFPTTSSAYQTENLSISNPHVLYKSFSSFATVFQSPARPNGGGGGGGGNVSLKHPAKVNFGSVKVGAAAKVKTILFTNPQKTAATLPNGAAAVSGNGFSLAGDMCSGATLGKKGAGCKVKVAFAPAQAGSASGTLTVAGNVVQLAASGKAPAQKK